MYKNKASGNIGVVVDAHTKLYNTVYCISCFSEPEYGWRLKKGITKMKKRINHKIKFFKRDKFGF